MRPNLEEGEEKNPPLVTSAGWTDLARDRLGRPWLSSLVFSFKKILFIYFFFFKQTAQVVNEQAAKVLIEPTTSSVTKHAAAKGRLYGKDYYEPIVRGGSRPRRARPKLKYRCE